MLTHRETNRVAELDYELGGELLGSRGISRGLSQRETKLSPPEEKIYGIVKEPSEGQFYIMMPDQEREGWAVEVAFHLKGPYDNPNSWRLVGDRESKYMVLWSQVDTSHSAFLRQLVPKIKKEHDRAKTSL